MQPTKKHCSIYEWLFLYEIYLIGYIFIYVTQRFYVCIIDMNFL